VFGIISTLLAATFRKHSEKRTELAANLEVRLDGVPQEDAEKFVATAHDFCPYSKALKNSIDVELTVIGD